MRLILANFDKVLGLKGYINFEENKPLLIYGENIAGKSNIINVLRYCLIPTFKGKKGYSEEKRLSKDEILLERNSMGSVEIFFEQKGKFYKLYYAFSRGSKNVRQIQRLYESDGAILPKEDGKRIHALRNLQWRDLGVSTSKALKEKLVELGIYSEVLDVLISASNVRNFSEAINGSVVRVPEIIAAKISKLHENSGKYLENLKKLHGVIVLEKDTCEKRIKELKISFSEVTKNLPQFNVDEIFIKGRTAENLEKVQQSISKELASIPERMGEIREKLALLSSEKYDLWTKAIESITTVLASKEELKNLLSRVSNLQRLQEILARWKVAFDQLPPDTHPEGLLTFNIPRYDDVDFSAFTDSEIIKSIFICCEEAKELMRLANTVCEKYKVPFKFQQINEVIKAYEELFKAIKKPSEPIGDPALISKRNGKTLVSIPLDVALKKVEYLKGVEPTPLVHRPSEMDEAKFQEEISRLQEEIRLYLSELRSAKRKLTEAKKLLSKAKKSRETLDAEIKLLKEEEQKNCRKLIGLTDDWKTSYDHMCKVFGVGYEEIDLSTPDSIDKSYEKILEKYAIAQGIFELDLIQHLKRCPEILDKYKGQKPTDMVKKVREEFQKMIEKLSELQREYQKVNEWILSNITQVEALESNIKTIEVASVALAVSQEIFARIYQKTDINRIIEELADKIEVSVRDMYSKLFPEDESFCFEHVEKGQFISTINGEPITHPSGSQRVAISIGIMLALSETFKLPMLLDEAFDRIDVNRLKFFTECITSIAKSHDAPQICLAGYKTYNIEKNPEVANLINNWKVYLVKRSKTLEKNIQPIQELTSDY